MTPGAPPTLGAPGAYLGLRDGSWLFAAKGSGRLTYVNCLPPLAQRLEQPPADLLESELFGSVYGIGRDFRAEGESTGRRGGPRRDRSLPAR
jgi:hypothetical protein